MSELSQKLRDLNLKLEDIQREQQYQREREAAFRDMSESTNSKAVWYTVAQIGVLIATCAWQMRHLKVTLAPELRGWSNTNCSINSGSSRRGKCTNACTVDMTIYIGPFLNFRFSAVLVRDIENRRCPTLCLSDLCYRQKDVLLATTKHVIDMFPVTFIIAEATPFY